VTTLNDVARLAGVSTMTVSRVVNGSGYTSPAAQARVNDAIAELGYMPNVLARQLRSNQTKTLALVLTDIANPFFTTIARGVEDTARAQGYAVMFCNTDESVDLELEYVRVLIQRRVDGVLLVPAADSSTSLDLLRSHKLPAVVLDRRIRSGQADEVRSDSEGGAYTLVRHLIDLGHRQIAVLTGPESVSTSADRVAGYRRALLEAGIDPTAQQVHFGQYNDSSGHEMTGRLLAAPTRPTAIFAGNNFIAFGAMQALAEAGLEIPTDMSIVVFDDLPHGWIMPFLTVIAQPAYEIGKKATELILERLASEKPMEPRTFVLPSNLIVRRSSAPPRSASTPPAPAGAKSMENYA